MRGKDGGCILEPHACRIGGKCGSGCINRTYSRYFKDHAYIRIHTGLYALYGPSLTWIWDIQRSDFIEYKIIGQTCPERRKRLC